jgi:DNA-directed RNA polymerase specialized sigma24 family protein
VKEIASERKMTENAVSVRLLRLRGKLKKHLEKQGFQV